MTREEIIEARESQRWHFDKLYRALLKEGSALEIEKLNPEWQISESPRLNIKHLRRVLTSIRQYESTAEYEFRRRALRKYIAEQGLADHTDEIIETLSQTSKRRGV